jgi:hypothetical protein
MLVSLGASPEAVERAAHRALAEVDGILHEPAPRLWLAAVTPLFQRYMIKFWIADFERHDQLESDVMHAFFRACRDEGVALTPVAAQPALTLDPRTAAPSLTAAVLPPVGAAPLTRSPAPPPAPPTRPTPP